LALVVTTSCSGGFVDWADDAIDQLYIEIGSKIRSARVDREWKQEELAAAVGLTRSSVANIEAGRQKMLVHSLMRIAESLQVAINTLLPDAELLSAMANSSRFVPDLTGHSDETRDFVTSALRRTREGSRGAAETT
jgi:transcriptional regulator with XRE-family HTH domain